MSGLRVRFSNEGAKHVSVVVSGYLKGDSDICLFDVADFNPRPKSLYLTEVNYSIQDNMELVLLWALGGVEEPELMIPLKGRGKFDFSSFRGLPSPKEHWEGKVILRALNTKLPPEAEKRYFLLVLHLEKG
jgi:hypothetical protein